ncbi:MAG: PorV/PorQ family protein [Elusimicrobia bacterium]|nr:PorV/PorQ family protein [Elusimicrobiota bacterium]
MKAILRLIRKGFTFAVLPAYVLCLLLSAFSFTRAAGETGAEFLLIGPNAKPASMGGIASAVTGDIDSVLYNPAGLAGITGRQFSATYSQWIDDVRYEYAAYGQSTELGVFGISAMYLHMGDMEGRSITGARTGSFSAYDLCVNLSYARNIDETVAAGGSIKFISQGIEEESARGAALDAGAQYKPEGSRFVFGGSLLNIGPAMKFVKDAYSLPAVLNLGAGYRKDRLVLGMDIRYFLADAYSALSIGSEYAIREYFIMRAGYMYDPECSDPENPKTETWDALRGITAGLGFNFMNYSLDYGFVPFTNLGITHRISFKGKF